MALPGHIHLFSVAADTSSRGGGGGGGRVLSYFHTYVGSSHFIGSIILNFNIFGFL